MGTVGRVDVGAGFSLGGVGKGQTPAVDLLWAPFLGGLGQGRCGGPVEGYSAFRLPFRAPLG